MAWESDGEIEKMRGCQRDEKVREKRKTGAERMKKREMVDGKGFIEDSQTLVCGGLCRCTGGGYRFTANNGLRRFAVQCRLHHSERTISP